MPVSALTADIAKTLIKNYTDNHLRVINSNASLTALRQSGSTSDSRCAWVSIDDLKSYISQVEIATAAHCPSVGGQLGIRIYFAEYPAANSPLWTSGAMPASLEPSAGMHTIMLTPTYNNGANNVDFDPNCANPDGTPIQITAVFSGATPTTTVLMMDHMQVTPPPYPIDGIFGPTTGAYMLDIANPPTVKP